MTKPFQPKYVCKICTSCYEEDLNANESGHFVALSNEHAQPRKCMGKLYPYIPLAQYEKLWDEIKRAISIEVVPGKTDSFDRIHKINKILSDSLNIDEEK